MASKRLHNSIRVSLAYAAQWDLEFQSGYRDGMKGIANYSLSDSRAYKQGYQVGENRRNRENKSLTA